MVIKKILTGVLMVGLLITSAQAGNYRSEHSIAAAKVTVTVFFYKDKRALQAEHDRLRANGVITNAYTDKGLIGFYEHGRLHVLYGNGKYYERIAGHELFHALKNVNPWLDFGKHFDVHYNNGR